jgi:hypothetical protein
VKIKKSSLRGLRQSPNASGAQHLTDQPPVFQQGNFLQIRAKGPAGRAQREAPVVTKCRGFSTSFALCHCQDPFYAIIIAVRSGAFIAWGTKKDSTTDRNHFQAELLSYNKG